MTMLYMTWIMEYRLQIGSDNNMKAERIARILYNMSLDMDYADYLEHSEFEISCITRDLELLKEFGCDNLIQALEMIATKNVNMEHWKDQFKSEE